MRGQSVAGLADLACDLEDLRRGNACFGLGRLGCDVRVVRLERVDKALKGARLVSVLGIQELAPVGPAFDEGAVVQALVQDHACKGQEQHRFGAGPRRQPPIRHRGGVRQAHIDHADL